MGGDLGCAHGNQYLFSKTDNPRGLRANVFVASSSNLRWGTSVSISYERLSSLGKSPSISHTHVSSVFQTRFPAPTSMTPIRPLPRCLCRRSRCLHLLTLRTLYLDTPLRKQSQIPYCRPKNCLRWNYLPLSERELWARRGINSAFNAYRPLGDGGITFEDA